MTLQLPRVDLVPQHTMVIGDSLETGGSFTQEHVYPATGEVVATTKLGGASEIDRAVAAAQAAFPAWRKLSSDKRRNLLLTAADVLEKHAEELANLGVLDNGAPMSIMKHTPHVAAQYFRYYAGWADKRTGQVIDTWSGPAFNYATFNPYGVIGAVVPWNGPLFASAMVMAAALAAGNCIILKPPEIAPFSIIRLGQLLLEAGFPAGVINVVPGGPEAGEALSRHPGVNKFVFIGSGATARKVLTSAAETLKPCALELGGKSAVLVFDDADLEKSVIPSLAGVIGMSGQGCVNGTRLLVQRGSYEKFLEMLRATSPMIPIGDPMDDTVAMGPVISEAACNRILGAVEASKSEGTRLVLGGERMGGEFANGYYLPLTIVADVDSRSSLAQKEVFGPVLAVTPFDTEEEAITMANDTPYGLGAYVHTRDLQRAHVVCDALDAGMIRVNGSHEGFSAATPFGGYKQSGYGRLGGEPGFREFLQTKNIWMSMSR